MENVKSKWKNLEMVNGSLVETGVTVEEGFGEFIGYVADIHDGRYTYKWDDKLKKYVKLEK